MKTAALKSPNASRKEIPFSQSMLRIDELTHEHATDFSALAEIMQAMQEKIEAVKAEHLPALRLRVAQAKASRAQLSDAIASMPNEFVRPRTRQLHGFKVGLRKLEGKITFTDESRAITLIKKHFPDHFDILVKTSFQIVKDAASLLPAADLKRLGGEIADSVDEVVIKSATGDVEKLVDALIREKAES